MANGNETEAEKGVDETPAGQAKRWTIEFAAARKDIKKWQDRGDKVVARFLDERDESTGEGSRKTDSRLNLFTSNVQTTRCIMYGNVPKVDVTRRFADSADDVARVSCEVMERVLNADIQKDGDSYADAVGAVLDDRLLPGGGFARLRYVVEMEDGEATPPILAPDGTEAAPAVPAQPRKKCEYVDTDYVYWKDVLWSTSRTWSDVRWVGFRADMSRDALNKRFGEDVGGKIPLGANKSRDSNGGEVDGQKNNPWGRASVWEIWSKEDRKVAWFVEGYPEVLEEKEDPLELDGFYPCPKPFFANVTTSRFIPTPDFVFAQDLYDEVDRVTNRIKLLSEVVMVRGVYDKANKEVQRLLTEGGQNELIPVDNFALFNEKGGLAGAVQWLPLDMVVNALNVLTQHRTTLMTLVDMVSGMSDIVRGQAQTNTTATEQSIKAKFASVRLQALRDEFARFCSDLQRLKAEIISKHFDESTLLEQANTAYTPDAADEQLIQQAVALIKSNHFAYRIEVKPESISLTDYAALKNERMEVLQAIGQYVQMATPLAQAQPMMAPMLLQLLQWLVAGIRGSQEIEGVLDQAITQVKAAAEQAQNQPPQQPPPDPKLQTEQFKSQAQQAHTHQELQADLVREQASTQATIQQEAAKAHFGMAQDQAREKAKLMAGIDSALGNHGANQ